jgi:hypothetical protein
VLRRKTLPQCFFLFSERGSIGDSGEGSLSVTYFDQKPPRSITTYIMADPESRDQSRGDGEEEEEEEIDDTVNAPCESMQPAY